jgi:hypothetical protein
MAGIDQPLRLAGEGVQPAKGLLVHDLQKDVEGGARRLVGPTMARHGLRQGLGQYGHAVAFVAVIEAATGSSVPPPLTTTFGSSLGRPCLSMAHIAGKRSPRATNCRALFSVVMDELMSSRTGSACLGMPTAIRLGVNSGSLPPNGATPLGAGPEHTSWTIRPRSVRRGRDTASASVWWLLAIATVTTPCCAMRSSAVGGEQRLNDTGEFD